MNSPRSIETIVPEVAAAMPSARDCEKKLYCGFPYLMPVTTFLGYISVVHYSNINTRTEDIQFTEKLRGYLGLLRS